MRTCCLDGYESRKRNRVFETLPEKILRFLDKTQLAPRFTARIGMKQQEEISLESLEERLSDLRPATPSSDLMRRLEMTIHQAEEELAEPANIIHHPFAQWAVAAAALFIALVTAVQTTRTTSNTDDGVASAPQHAVSSESEIRPVYQIVNGELIPVSGSPSLQKASYRGMRVINGKAYRDFRDGEKVFMQPVLKPTSD